IEKIMQSSPSSKSSSHSMVYTLNSPSTFPGYCLLCQLLPFEPFLLEVCRACDIIVGSKPTCSMISISPYKGQLPTSGSIQKAGQVPFPDGRLIRASILPYFTKPFPLELIRADVY